MLNHLPQVAAKKTAMARTIAGKNSVYIEEMEAQIASIDAEIAALSASPAAEDVKRLIDEISALRSAIADVQAEIDDAQRRKQEFADMLKSFEDEYAAIGASGDDARLAELQLRREALAKDISDMRVRASINEMNANVTPW